MCVCCCIRFSSTFLFLSVSIVYVVSLCIFLFIFGWATHKQLKKLEKSHNLSSNWVYFLLFKKNQVEFIDPISYWYQWFFSRIRRIFFCANRKVIRRFMLRNERLAEREGGRTSKAEIQIVKYERFFSSPLFSALSSNKWFKHDKKT